jgi:hypothetical protein
MHACRVPGCQPTLQTPAKSAAAEQTLQRPSQTLLHRCAIGILLSKSSRTLCARRRLLGTVSSIAAPMPALTTAKGTSRDALGLQHVSGWRKQTHACVCLWRLVASAQRKSTSISRTKQSSWHWSRWTLPHSCSSRLGRSSPAPTRSTRRTAWQARYRSATQLMISKHWLCPWRRAISQRDQATNGPQHTPNQPVHATPTGQPEMHMCMTGVGSCAQIRKP